MKLPQLPQIKGVFVTGTDTDVGKTVFVTGTDTDVGKTVIAAGLTAALRRRGLKAVYFKPMQSGCPAEGGRLIPTDAMFARELAGLKEPLELLTPITLRLPLAPGVAAAQEGVAVDLSRVAQALRELAGRYEFFVIEGAGGLYVPLIDTNFLVLDLIRWLKLPLLVVARAGLGTINHTALTVMAAREKGIEVAGIILNRCSRTPNLAEQTNPAVIEAITGRPILARVPEIGGLDEASGREALITALAGVAVALA
ncbi:MAG: dethiobiotin synthase [Deltaproteobacteria bacterium]|nr:dethiobiotin synthase [Deltaproteobacteria bacterium]